MSEPKTTTTTSGGNAMFIQVSESPYCPDFVPFSVYDIVDPGMDSCDHCSLPRHRHPVQSYDYERGYVDALIDRAMKPEP